MPENANVLDLDTLIGAPPVVKYKGKDYPVDPDLENVMKITGAKEQGEAIGSEQMRKLVAAAVPGLPKDLTNLQLLPVYMFLTTVISKAMGIETSELKDIAGNKSALLVKPE